MIARGLTSLLGFTALALAVACGGGDRDKEEEPTGPTLFEVRLRSLPEHAPLSVLGGQPRPTLRQVVVDLEKRLDKDTTAGLFLRLEGLGGGWAKVHELVELVARYRAAGKPVHCHFDDLDNAGYALGSACDRLTMTPSGTLNLVGIAAQVVHARQALQELGLKAELSQVGRFKGAAEPLTRDAMSPEVAQNLGTLLDDLSADMVARIESSRPDLKGEIQNLMDAGPYASKRALSAGLIDGLAYDDAARSGAKKAASAQEVRRLFEVDRNKKPSLSELLEAFTAEPDRGDDERERLAVVHVLGEIMTGERATFERAFSEPFVTAVRKLADTDAVKAVVVRIDSPGGSAMASDRMWHALRRLQKRKPVVVSVGGMAASGGYYIACAGTEIWATPGSIVGSIGVVGGKVSAANLAERVGVQAQTLRRGKHAAWLSPLQPFSDSERRSLDALLKSTYDRFIHRVSIGRGVPAAELDAAAQGRVMTGSRGKDMGLVDRIGTLHDALARARELGGLPDDAPVQVWPDADDPLAALSGLMGQAHATAPDPLRSKLEQALSESIGNALGGLLSLGQEPVLTALPYALSVR